MLFLYFFFIEVWKTLVAPSDSLNCDPFCSAAYNIVAVEKKFYMWPAFLTELICCIVNVYCSYSLSLQLKFLDCSAIHQMEYVYLFSLSTFRHYLLVVISIRFFSLSRCFAYAWFTIHLLYCYVFLTIWITITLMWRISHLFNARSWHARCFIAVKLHWEFHFYSAFSTTTQTMIL